MEIPDDNVFAFALGTLAAACVIAGGVTMFAANKGQGQLLSFLLVLKTLFVAVFVAFTVMLITLSYASDLELATRQLQAQLGELRQVVHVELVLSATLASVMSFVTAKVIFALERFLGAIGTHKYSPEDPHAAGQRGALRVVDAIQALFLSVIVTSVMALLGLFGDKRLLTSSEFVVGSAWLGAFLTYLFTSAVTRARQRAAASQE